MSLQFINAEKRVNDTVIFSSFNLTAEAGMAVALYSSVNVREQLIEILLGRTPLSQGTFAYPGQADEIGFLFLRSGLYERLTVKESLQFTKRLFGSQVAIQDAIRLVQLESKQNTRINRLSFSENKRVQLACLLIQDPAIYVLEEPDQNLDLETKRIFLSILQELKIQKKTIFILTGTMESAVTSADEVYRLDENGIRQIPIHEEDKEDMNTDNHSDSAENVTITVQPVKLEKIPTKVNDKIVLFDPTEIDYIESNEGQSFLHIKGESFPSVFILNDLEQRLMPFGFFRCHRSYIVNLQKVREVITWTRNSYSLVLDDGKKSTIPLSKSKMAELKEMLGL